MARILVVDDELMIRVLISETISTAGHECLVAASIAQGLQLAASGVDIVLLDVLLPDGDGVQHVQTFSQTTGRPDVIVITGYGDADAAEMALKAGAWDYLVKPLKPRDLLETLVQTLQWRRDRGISPDFARPGLIGESQALLEALSELQKAATSHMNVLLFGETGSGKELFAAALHANSPRRNGPFVTVDCTSLPETLVEANLFGHARGAFTGADRAREGLITSANHGTLFLDEVGELHPVIQGTFLRAVELRRFRPVGELREISSDFRLVTATNRNLYDMEDMGLFRSDLHFRLRGITITVPPLRQRKEDIPLLTRHFVQLYCTAHGLPSKEVPPSLDDILSAYDWPGNVRELRQAIERACAASGSGDVLFGRHLPAEIRIVLTRKKILTGGLDQQTMSATHPLGSLTAEMPVDENTTASQRSAPDPAEKGMPPLSAEKKDALPPDTRPPCSLKEAKLQAELEYLHGLMQFCRGNIPRALQISGVSRGHFYALLHKHGLDQAPQP